MTTIIGLRATLRMPATVISLAMAFLTSIAASLPADSPTTFEVVEIAHPEGSLVFPTDVNTAGEVCGAYIDSGGKIKPFLWRDGTFVDLAEIALNSSHNVEAIAINNLGQMVGNYNIGSADPEPHQFWMWTDANGDRQVDDGEVQYIAHPEGTQDDPDSNKVESLNDAGHFVGTIPGGSDLGAVAFFWDGSYTIIDHVGEFGDDFPDEAVSINSSDEVALRVEMQNNNFQAFHWTPGGETQLPDCENATSGTLVRAINNRGHIVGECRFGGNGRPIIYLATDDYGFPAGHHLLDAGFGKARDVNDAGWVVGARNSFAATLWIPDGIGGFDAFDLGELAGLDPGTFTNATRVSELFSILARDTSNKHFLIRPSGDRDGDGLLDLWECNGLDINSDGIVDIDFPSLGADPDHKDLFVEVDVMGSVPLDPNAIQDVIDAFDVAPVENPDGNDGITLHIDMATADTIGFEETWDDDFVRFGEIKANLFGTSEERDNVNSEAILAAKKRTFRYCTVVNAFAPSGALGWGEQPGNDFMVAIGQLSGERHAQGSTLMHELGHNLNLSHGGSDDHNYKPNYVSVMNYGFDFWRDTAGNRLPLDFSQELIDPVDEQHLDETLGVFSVIYNDVFVFHGYDDMGTRKVDWIRLDGSAHDWNHDGNEETDVSVDLNFLGAGYPDGDTATPDDVHVGHNDWEHIVLPLGTTGPYADSAHIAPPFEEMTVDELFFMRENLPPPPVDVGETINVDIVDVIRGFQIAGDLADVHESDDSYLKFNTGITLFSSEPPVWIEFSGTLSSDNPATLNFQMEAATNTTGITQTIESFNWNTGQYEEIDSRWASLNDDSLVTVDLTENIANYVQSGTGAIKTRTGWRATDIVFVFPWTICIDQVVWTATE